MDSNLAKAEVAANTGVFLPVCFPDPPFRNHLRDESGVAFLELVLIVLPFVLAMIFATFECANLLYYKQGVAFIARETALYGFKECAPYESQPSRDACIDHVQTTMQILANAYLSPDADVLVGLHESKLNGPVHTLYQSPKANTPGGFDSKIVTLVQTDVDLNNLVRGQERVVSAEVNLIYKPLLISSISYLHFTDVDFYEVAMY